MYAPKEDFKSMSPLERWYTLPIESINHVAFYKTFDFVWFFVENFSIKSPPRNFFRESHPPRIFFEKNPLPSKIKKSAPLGTFEKVCTPSVSLSRGCKVDNRTGNTENFPFSRPISRFLISKREMSGKFPVFQNENGKTGNHGFH